MNEWLCFAIRSVPCKYVFFFFWVFKLSHRPVVLQQYLVSLPTLHNDTTCFYCLFFFVFFFTEISYWQMWKAAAYHDQLLRTEWRLREPFFFSRYILGVQWRLFQLGIYCYAWSFFACCSCHTKKTKRADWLLPLGCGHLLGAFFLLSRHYCCQILFFQGLAYLPTFFLPLSACLGPHLT